MKLTDVIAKIPKIRDGIATNFSKEKFLLYSDLLLSLVAASAPGGINSMGHITGLLSELNENDIEKPSKKKTVGSGDEYQKDNIEIIESSVFGSSEPSPVERTGHGPVENNEVSLILGSSDVKSIEVNPVTQDIRNKGQIVSSWTGNVTAKQLRGIKTWLQHVYGKDPVGKTLSRFREVLDLQVRLCIDDEMVQDISKYFSVHQNKYLGAKSTVTLISPNEANAESLVKFVIDFAEKLLVVDAEIIAWHVADFDASAHVDDPRVKTLLSENKDIWTLRERTTRSILDHASSTLAELDAMKRIENDLRLDLPDNTDSNPVTYGRALYAFDRAHIGLYKSYWEHAFAAATHLGEAMRTAKFLISPDVIDTCIKVPILVGRTKKILEYISTISKK